MNNESVLKPAQKLGSILFRLIQTPSGIPVKVIREEYSLDERTFRNYLKYFDGIPELIDDDGKAMVTTEKRGDEKYLIFKSSCILSEGAEGYFAAFYMASSLMNFLDGTKIYEPIERWMKTLNRRGLRIPIQHLDKKIYSVAEFPKDYSGQDEVLKKLLRGTMEQRKIWLSYSSMKRDSIHEDVRPYTIMQYRNGLYLLGKSAKHDRDVTMFAVDRIKEVHLLPESFHYPSKFTPSEYMSSSFGIIHDGKTYDVKIRFSKEVAKLVKERKYHKTAKLTDMKNGCVELTMRVESISQLRSWVLSFGNEAEVIKPKELKSWMKEQLRAMGKKYKL